MIRSKIFLLALVALLLAGCSQGETSVTESDTATDSVAAEPDQSGEAGTTAVPVWQTLPLTDSHTGASFTIADLSGKAVFVEPMATWCTNCRRQLNNVRAVQAEFSSDEAVFIAVSVETNISDEELVDYAGMNDFPFVFAVATPEFLQALVDQFGNSITSPPSTPHFIVRPDGTFTELTTGPESAEQIAAQLRELTG